MKWFLEDGISGVGYPFEGTLQEAMIAARNLIKGELVGWYAVVWHGGERVAQVWTNRQWVKESYRGVV